MRRRNLRRPRRIRRRGGAHDQSSRQSSVDRAGAPPPSDAGRRRSPSPNRQGRCSVPSSHRWNAAFWRPCTSPHPNGDGGRRTGRSWSQIRSTEPSCSGIETIPTSSRWPSPATHGPWSCWASVRRVPRDRSPHSPGGGAAAARRGELRPRTRRLPRPRRPPRPGGPGRRLGRPRRGVGMRRPHRRRPPELHRPPLRLDARRCGRPGGGPRPALRRRGRARHRDAARRAPAC